MIPVYELFIAIRHLTSRRRQTIFSVLAVGLAVMLLMWSQAMMVGFTDEMYSKTVDTMMPHVTVEPQEGEDYIHLYRKLIEDIDGIDGVVGISPVLSGPATFEYKGKNKNVVMQGIRVEAHDSVMYINDNIIEGSFRDLEISPNSVVVGDALAEKLDVEIGDTIDASFPEANPANLKVVGIYNSGTPMDETLAFTSLSTVQDFLEVSNVVTTILVRGDDRERAQAISEKIDTLGYPASGWKETNPEIIQTLKMEGTSNAITLGLIIIIASFGIVSTLFMVVMEKTKEIGMLMAMGVSRRSILIIFVMESGILGLLGALIGVILGATLAIQMGSFEYEMEVMAGITSIPFVVRLQDAVIIVLFTFLLNLIAGIYPASRASKLKPVEAIGRE
ncbi:MAG: ABC transporter permease [ANME-2 cluster archaeon]|nr:ABC transporter permease [ANME-2 cluster archaeon]MBC2700881.1 ABC transporter permease [ANME-2 cluster archaeon]MBC2707023.1 ABC transporter permease [ANME-2 cluster archaeon]MBC2748744.1 ABC transporter permease [ANME-2 cluster archaeon]MBC2763057.1 ABC transporter permease [ANME-2 cluster archaeon]